MPTDARLPLHREQEAKVFLHDVEAQRLIGHGRVDTKAARIRTAKAADHRHELDQGLLAECGLDELPVLANARKRSRLPARCQVNSQRPMLRAVLEDVVDQLLVGEAQHVVEVPDGLLGVTASMWPAQHRYGAPGLKAAAERVGQQSRIGKGADEDQVQIVGEFLEEVLFARVSDERNVVALLLAPRGDDLGHDAGQVRQHDPVLERVGCGLGPQVDDTDLELFHVSPSTRPVPSVSGPTWPDAVPATPNLCLSGNQGGMCKG